MAVMALPDDCYTHALMRGGPEHRGWGQDRHMIADLIDAINQNTRATGNWKSAPPKISPYPRPRRLPASGEGGSKRPGQKVTVAQLYAQMDSSKSKQRR